MKIKKAVSKKLLNAVLVGAICVVPVLGSVTISQAAQSSRRDKINDRGTDQEQNRNDETNNDRYQSFTGTVINESSDRGFRMRAGGTTYNVVASTKLPRGLNQGDVVRVYGQRYSDNEIRNASVSIISQNNRGNNNRHNNNPETNGQRGNYQKFTGTVVSVESSSQFDVRIGNTTYNVYAAGTGERQLHTGDVVRIYGRRYGNNDIRNASVSILSQNNRNDDNNRRDSNNNRFETFTGTVSAVESTTKFDVRIDGKIYNVYQSGKLARVDQNDEVRIYGQRYGNNDIRNANVVVVRNR
jgi:membrane protein implicated in regulation of membrane protease activity